VELLVSFERSACGRLFMGHFFKGSDHGNSFLGVEKKATCFSFRGKGRGSVLQRAWIAPLGVGLGGALGALGRSASEKEVTCSTAASIGEHKQGKRHWNNTVRVQPRHTHFPQPTDAEIVSRMAL
jgi:hypothetical protein